MGFFTKQAPAAARQLTPATPPPTLSFSPMKEVMSVEPTVFVHHESFLSASLSDAELLNVYNEELFIEGQATPEDELADHTSQDCDGVVPRRHSDRIVPAGLVFSVQVPFVTHNALAVPALVYNPQQPCRPYPATADIMFDNATPEDTAKELALCTIFNPSEFPVLFMRPIKPVAPYTPSPKLLDTSDLRVQPVLATTTPLCDPVSQILDFDLPVSQVQDTASVYVPKQDRSLMYSPPVCSDSDEEELDGDHFDDQARQRRDSIVKNGPRDWEVEYDRVLRRITGQPFFPGLEHLSNVESRSAFMTYDMDVQAPKATTVQNSDPVPDSYRTGTCTCLVYKGCVGDKAADDGLSAQSSLDLIDDTVDYDSFVDTDVVYVSSVSSPTQNDAFNVNHVLPSFLDLSESRRSQSPASDSDSDSSDKDVERPSSPPSLPLHYLDADTQQYIGFSAFNQYSVYVDNEEVAPRIHRDGDDYDDEDLDLVDGIVEIGDSPTLQNDESAAVLSLVEANVFYNLKENIQMHVQWDASSLTVGSRHMYISRKFGWTKYRRLIPLDSIKEAPETFEDQPASVQPLQARRANFMDNEDSKDDVNAPSSASSTDSFDSDSLYAVPVLTVVENLHEFFDAAIWHHQPSLQSTYPVGSQPQSADLFLDPEILDALEVEINGLIAYMLDCITAGRFDNLTELASDFQWATCAIAINFPALSLLERLGEVVELVAAQVVALGTS